MKRILIFIIIMYSNVLYSRDIIVDFYVENKHYGKMNITELQDVLVSSSYTKEMIKAEKNNKVIAKTTPDKFTLTEDNIIVAETTIEWINEKNEVFKTLVLELTFDMNDIKQEKNIIKDIYIKIALYGFLPSVAVIAFIISGPIPASVISIAALLSYFLI